MQGPGATEKLIWGDPVKPLLRARVSIFWFFGPRGPYNFTVLSCLGQFALRFGMYSDGPHEAHEAEQFAGGIYTTIDDPNAPDGTEPLGIYGNTIVGKYHDSLGYHVSVT
jgi:hypothetical protein